MRALSIIVFIGLYLAYKHNLISCLEQNGEFAILKKDHQQSTLTHSPCQLVCGGQYRHITCSSENK